MRRLCTHKEITDDKASRYEICTGTNRVSEGVIAEKATKES